MKNRIYALLLAFLPLLSFAQSVPFPSGNGRDFNAIEPYGYEQNGTNWDTSPYLPFIYHGIWFRMMLPAGLTWNAQTKTFVNPSGTKYPIILFFHGRGEVGDDNNRQLINGGQIHRDAVLSGAFPGILLYPQSTGYQGGKDLLDKVMAQVPVDINRVYVHGLSGGGGEVWNFLKAYPSTVAAAFPMSWADKDAKIEPLLYIPLRESQGGLDSNPSPGYSKDVKDWFDANGGHLEYFLLPKNGHSTWNEMYGRADFFPWFLSHSKAEITVRFDRNLICPGGQTSVILGYTPGLQGYEWYKDGVKINGATSYNYTATTFGNYTARINNKGTWYNSTNTVVVGSRGASVTPNIILNGQSLYIPDVNGSSSVTLAMPDGYASYKWYKEGQTEAVASTQTLNVTSPGNYTASITETNGCPTIPSIPSPAVAVKDATGPSPDPAANLQASGASLTSIQLTWENNGTPSLNETGFEVYRSDVSGGPYDMIGTTGADILTYLDINLIQNQTYYYKVRAVAANGASLPTPEVAAITQVDITPPTPPNNITRTTFAGNNNIRINWGAAGTDNIAVTGYVVYLREYPTTTWTQAVAVAATAVNATVLNLPTGKFYYFMVKSRDAAGNFSIPSQETYLGSFPVQTSPALLTGINYKRYSTGTASTLPNFDLLAPNATGNQVQILMPASGSLPNPADNFGLRFEGHLAIGSAGNYIFNLTCDEGAKLYIDGNLVVDHDAPHTASLVKTATVNLAVGYHAIRFDYFDKTGNQAFNLRWQCDELGIALATIPTTVLYRNYDPAGNFIPAPLAAVAPSNLQVASVTYNTINLSWNAYKGTGTTIEVYSSLDGSSSANSWTLRASLPATATTWAHTGLPPSKKYFYKVRAAHYASVTASAAYSSVVNGTTAGLPPVPPAPTALTVTNVTATSAKLNWSDNASNEDNYEVYKSSPDNAHYAKTSTLAANTITATDNTLFPHTSYYFKVAGKNVSGISGYTNEVQIQTANSVPVMTPIASRTIRHSGTYSIPLAATDADGDDIIIGSHNLPAFAQLFDFGNGKGEIVLTPASSDTIPGTYNGLQVYAQDIFGGVSTVSFDLKVNNNHTPAVSDPGAITMKETYKQSIDIVGTDVDNEALTWNIQNLPSFVAATVDGNTVHLVLEPGTTNSGTYNFSLTATDPIGALVTRNITLTVTDFNPVYKVFVNFRDNPGGAGTTTASAPWNNFSIGLNNVNLTNEAGATSGVIISTNAGTWQSGTAGKTPGVYPNPVQAGYYFFQAGTTTDSRFIKLAGLNPAGKYNVNILASRTGDTGTNRTGQYTIGAQTLSLNANENANTTANFTAIVPNAAGEINITVKASVLNGYALVNALVLESYIEASAAPEAPLNLTASNVNSQIKLSWVDNSSSELATDIYRSTDDVSYNKIASVSTNVVTYTDASAVAGVTYYYKVLATNNIGSSPFSNTATISGPNHAPTITAIPSIQMGEEEMKWVIIQGADVDGDDLTWELVNNPYFAWLEAVDNHSTSLVLSPFTGDAGEYVFTATANDGKGSLTTATINLRVGTPGEIFYKINFTRSDFIAAAPWNNISNPAANQVLANLKNDSNVASGIFMTNVNGWQTQNVDGYNSTNNSGIYPDAVTRTSFYVQDAGTRQLAFTGLDPSKTYDFTFYASRMSSAETRIANYSIVGSNSTSLDASNNINNVAKILGVKSNASGQVTVNIQRASGTYAYLGSLVLREYTAVPVPQPPVVPTNLKLLAGRTTMKILWTDASVDETGFEIYRSATSNGTYSLVTTVAANTTLYVNTSLTSNTTYYYKVRAINGNGASSYTAEASATTYSYAISINFDGSTTITNVRYAAGWNNIAGPGAGAQIPTGTTASFTDDLNAATGVTLTQGPVPFAGTNDGGMTTGNNTGIVPDGVLNGMWWVDKLQTVTIRFNNLSFLYKYNFVFTAARNMDGNRTTNYTIGTTTVSVDAAFNTRNFAQINNVVPQADGTVTVSFFAPQASAYGYISGIIIQAFPNPGGRIAADAEVVPAELITQAEAFPNPFSDRLTLKMSKAGSFNVKLLSINGTVAFHTEFEAIEEQEVEIPLNSEMASGVYLLRVIESSGKTQTIKLLKK